MFTFPVSLGIGFAVGFIVAIALAYAVLILSSAET